MRRTMAVAMRMFTDCVMSRRRVSLLSFNAPATWAVLALPKHFSSWDSRKRMTFLVCGMDVRHKKFDGLEAL